MKEKRRIKNEMKICIISDSTYRACTPNYERNLSFYGSEGAHAIIAEGFTQLTNHEVHFVAPHGSERIGTFHPIQNFNGLYAPNEILDEISMENPKFLVKDLAEFDFVLDFSAICRNIEELNQYHGFHNYICFRNGYNAYINPRLRIQERNYVCPSEQNARIFRSVGFADTRVAYYGIPDDFYNPRPLDLVSPADDVNNHTFSNTSVTYAEYFENNRITPKEYFLYPHRPTSEKGSYHVVELAKTFPQETFVFMVSNNPVPQHMESILDLKRIVTGMQLNNVRFVELPLSAEHHYFKRELMRCAKAVLSPFNPSIYKEGFGLTNGEAISCGTPVIITDSESTRELWRNEVDGLFIPYNDNIWGFKMAIRFFNSFSFKPENRYPVDRCIKRYEEIMKEIMDNNKPKPPVKDRCEDRFERLKDAINNNIK